MEEGVVRSARRRGREWQSLPPHSGGRRAGFEWLAGHVLCAMRIYGARCARRRARVRRGGAVHYATVSAPGRCGVPHVHAEGARVGGGMPDVVLRFGVGPGNDVA